MNFILTALLAGLGTWFVTALGAGTVIFFKNCSQKATDAMLGFSAGIMTAASFWSMLEPSVNDYSESSGAPVWLSVTVAFLLGSFMIIACDRTSFIMSRYSGRVRKDDGLFLLIMSITTHNIPEGLAVGVAFGALAGGYTREAFFGAVSIAAGIAIQNFPEGAAVSLPLRQCGYSRTKAFLIGQATALTEPVFAVIGAVCVSQSAALLPVALSFAAGNMITVCVQELIPKCSKNRRNGEYLPTVSYIIGFAVMMSLDVALG